MAGTNDDLELKSLGQFTGTQNYYNIMGVKVTDGVKYIMDNGYSWFVTDAIAVIKTKLKNQEFLSIKLILDDGKAKMVITNGNENVLYKQEYKWTDAKVEVELFYTNEILLLSREY